MQINKEMLVKMTGLPDFAELKSYDKLNNFDLSYEELNDLDQQREIIKQLIRNKEDKVVVGTDERSSVWENGWSENLCDLQRSKSIESLMPKYFRRGQPFRLFQKFIHSDNYKLDYEFGRVLKSCLFEYYFKPFDNVYEFGCGTGFNLVEIAEMFPDKQLFGLDFTKASGEILKILNNDLGYNLTGSRFDFFKPDKTFHIKQNSAVYTAAALEQVGTRWDAFLEYLLSEHPALVLHLEPIEELYDTDDSVLDYLAMDFNKKRGYLSGYYTKLKELDAEGKIHIIDARRTFFGNWNDESYSLIVWKPL